MTGTIPPITEIEAVNAMIRTIGMSPATSLDVDDVDVQQAVDTLRDTSRQVQSVGWDFNTEEDYSLSPNSAGEIVIPPNVTTVKVPRWQYDAVVRGNRLYNRKTHSFTWDREVRATVTMLFDYEELPQSARSYIAVRAARVFADNAEGLADAHTFSQQDELTALIALQNYEAETGNYRLSTRN